MFGRRYTLARIFGFDIRIDLTWLILAALIVWTLSAGYFPASYADLPASTYFWMGLLGAIGLFASIIAHELAHSVVGRRLGMQIKGITLFVFGGAAEMTEEPASARAEFLMAAAGPAASFALAVIFYAIGLIMAALGAPGPLATVVQYLGVINVILGLFNLAPAFPLDGGRILRAALWHWRKDLLWATRQAAQVGGAVGFALILLGILNVILAGNLVGGMWWFLIGLFIRAAAAQSYQQLVARRSLEGVRVRRFMNAEPVVVSPDVPVGRLIDDYILDRRLKMLPVVAEGRLLGSVSLAQIRERPREEWARLLVRDVFRPRSPEDTVPPEMPAAEALALMQRTGNSRLMVAEGHRLLGIVSLRDMMSYLALRMELDESRPFEGAPGR